MIKGCLLKRDQRSVMNKSSGRLLVSLIEMGLDFTVDYQTERLKDGVRGFKMVVAVSGVFK